MNPRAGGNQTIALILEMRSLFSNHMTGFGTVRMCFDKVQI